MLIKPHVTAQGFHCKSSGNGSIMRNKRAAKKRVGIDIEPSVPDILSAQLRVLYDRPAINDDAF
jgi:hypothetical protein